MSDNIPFDMQIEIIKKVDDIKSLLGFRSVSKRWLSFINSSEFIAYYGIHNTQPHRSLLRYKNKIKYISLVDEQDKQNLSPNVPLLLKQLDKSNVIGSSCGLWCMHGYDTSRTEMVVIWNPSIRKSVGIVVPSVLKITTKKFTHFGFGVCPTTYDPTIVGISWDFLEWECKAIGAFFTLSSNTWKMIPSINMPRESIRLRLATQVAIDRFIFWVAHDRIDGVSRLKNLIVSFDLITQEFEEVSLPVSLAERAAWDISISKLNESLVVSAYTYEVNGKEYGVWMMGEEGGVMTSFTKLFTIKTLDDDLSIRKVLGFTMSGEPIIEKFYDDWEFANNPENLQSYPPFRLEIYKQSSEEITYLGIGGKHASFFVCPYVETLLLVDHSEKVMAMVQDLEVTSF